MIPALNIDSGLQQVAGEMFANELVIGDILIERADKVIR
jgi:hypothetical protein